MPNIKESLADNMPRRLIKDAIYDRLSGKVPLVGSSDEHINVDVEYKYQSFDASLSFPVISCNLGEETLTEAQNIGRPMYSRTLSFDVTYYSKAYESAELGKLNDDVELTSLRMQKLLLSNPMFGIKGMASSLDSVSYSMVESEKGYIGTAQLSFSAQYIFIFDRYE